jgi:imidazolonepropionase-like amidohydrolase
MCRPVALILTLFLLPVLSFGQSSQFHFQHPTPAPTLIQTGRILDVTSGKYLDHQAILTEGERIKQIGPWDQLQAHAPNDVIHIDLSQATVLPGLIDCHAHPFVSMDPHMSGGEGLTTAIALMSPTLRVFIGAHNLMEDLEAGITSVRVVGHSGLDGDISLRDAINGGLVPGPRLQACGRKLTPLGGQSMYLQPALAKPILEQEYRQVSGPDDARRAVRESLAGGVDWIKIAIDAGAGPMWKFRYMDPVDVRAIIEEAHRVHLKVAVHAIDTDAIQTAIDAGADSIEHAYLATDQQLQQMKDKGIFLVANDMPDNGGSPDSQRRLQQGMRIGVKIAIGTDLWVPFPGKTYGQNSLMDLYALHDEGMPNLDVMRSATLVGADLMGWSADVGAIAVGKFADIIAVSGDPLQALDHVSFVMKGGTVVKNRHAKN